VSDVDGNTEDRSAAPLAEAETATVSDNADLQDVYDTERQLLFVAFARARDHLLVTSGKPASEFGDDMQS